MGKTDFYLYSEPGKQDVLMATLNMTSFHGWHANLVFAFKAAHEVQKGFDQGNVNKMIYRDSLITYKKITGNFFVKNKSEIIIRPIGIIHTPFADVNNNVPIQGRILPDTEGYIELYTEYIEGCRDVDGYSHIILIYHLNRCTDERLTVIPYMDSEERGIFSTRSPHRPNHLGMTIVELAGIENNILKIKGVDMLDGTPLIDIKPYNPDIDCVSGNEKIRSGWMEQYTSGGKKPVIIKTGSRTEWLHEKK